MCVNQRSVVNAPNSGSPLHRAAEGMWRDCHSVGCGEPPLHWWLLLAWVQGAASSHSPELVPFHLWGAAGSG